MSQALDIDLLAEAETVASALRSRLGMLGPDIRPPIRESKTLGLPGFSRSLGQRPRNRVLLPCI
jgi:hypothetical protein